MTKFDIESFIFQTLRDGMNIYRAGMGLPPLKHLPEPQVLNGRDEDYLEADEDEPDRYPDDSYLDAPEHDQCVNGKFKP